MSDDITLIISEENIEVNPSGENVAVKVSDGTLEHVAGVALAAHAALTAGVHGGTIALLGAANVFTQLNTFGVHGVTDAEVKLASSQRVADFWFDLTYQTFDGNTDPILYIGWNPPYVSGFVVAEQSIYEAFEAYYRVGENDEYVEWYVQWRSPGGTFGGRTFQSSIKLSTGVATIMIDANQLQINSSDGLTMYAQHSSGNWMLYGKYLAQETNAVTFLRAKKVGGGYADILLNGGDQWQFGNTMLFKSNVLVGSGATTYYNLCINSGEITVNGTGVIHIRNASVVPATQYANIGTIYLEGGIPKFRNPSGTVYTFDLSPA